MKTSPVIRLLVLLLAWGAMASLAGACRLFVHLPPLVVPVLVAGLTVAFSLGIRRVSWMKAAVEMLGVRSMVAAHLVRFVGVYFLWLHAQGRLPVEFAMRAGWGDIVAAAGALVLLFVPDGVGFRRALLVWNVLGTADLLIAVGTGGWLNATRPGSMIELAGLPLTLVPLWFVPMLLANHLYLMERPLRGSLCNFPEKRAHA